MKRTIDVSAAIIFIVAAALLASALTYLYIDRHRAAPAQSKLDEAMEVIEQYYVGDYSRAELEDSAVNAMVEALGDRWSYYMSAEELDAYLDSMKNQFSGIGIVIEQAESAVRIISVYSGSPAEEAGLEPGMLLHTVSGQSVEGLTVAEVGMLVREKLEEGSVLLEVTDADGLPAAFEVEPGVIQVNPVSYELLEDGIGYIRVENFETGCADGIKEACKAFSLLGVEGLIFDLRLDPGGQLGELLDALDYLLPEGVIFRSEEKGREMTEDRSDASCLELPMVVLVDSETYSAAEFFAAALQEYEWAVIVGEQTTGKGYAQITTILSDGSAIHISARKYYTPKGVSLAGVGITPDLEVALEDEDWIALYYGQLPHEEDEQLQAAVATLRELIRDGENAKIS